MYIIDRLICLKQNDNHGVDEELASYFISRIQKIETKTLTDCIKETGISKASIHRFYNKAGFLNYKEFVKELSKEYTYLLKKEKNFQPVSIEEYYQYLKEIDINIKTLLENIKKAKRIFLFGRYDEILEFNHLNYYCVIHGKEKHTLSYWNKERNNDMLKTLQKDDLLILVDIDYTLTTLFENMMDRSYLIDVSMLQKLQCHKCFIGQANQQEQDNYMLIGIPYHPNMNIRKTAISYVDNIIMQNLLEDKS